MNFLERFRKPNTSSISDNDGIVQIKEDAASREDRLRLQALTNSNVLTFINQVRADDEMRIVGESSWCPEIYVRDWMYEGIKYDHFTIVGREDGKVQIGTVVLGTKEAKDLALVEEAFWTALRNGKSIFTEPEIEEPEVPSNIININLH